MKFTINIECTPEEARSFLGLPDVTALQEQLMKDLEDKMRENIQTMDPETMVKTWMPAAVQGWGEMQKMFWGQMGMTPPGAPQDDSNNKS